MDLQWKAVRARSKSSPPNLAPRPLCRGSCRREQKRDNVADLLPDTPTGASHTPFRPVQQRHSQQLNAASPALLIDLMDFGAESTFQLPTTPRRQTPAPGTAFGTVGGGGVSSKLEDASVKLPSVTASTSGDQAARSSPAAQTSPCCVNPHPHACSPRSGPPFP